MRVVLFLVILTIVSLNDGSAETVTYTVTVSGGKFYIDGEQQDTLTFKKAPYIQLIKVIVVTLPSLETINNK